jgi:GNAT superfamily N-acetyltransferase
MDFPSTFPSHPDFDPSKASGITPPILEREPSQALPDSTFPRVNQAGDAPGHHPLGRTIAIHSVCVHPAYQKLGLGKTLFKAYLQRMEGSGIADRAALIARPALVPWYIGNYGFEDAGNSKVQFGGGEWKDMVFLLKHTIHD